MVVKDVCKRFYYDDKGASKNTMSDGYTQEMKDWFETRTKKHIELVRKYCSILEDEYEEPLSGLYAMSEFHDKSKFAQLEMEPYIHISWKYKLQDEGEKYDPPKEIKDQMNAATFHHIKFNAHHPDFWDPNLKDGALNAQDRDKPGKNMVNAHNMIELFLAEMVADWAAMSKEKGTSLKKWADDNINIRWAFNNNQCEFIYGLLDVCICHK